MKNQFPKKRIATELRWNEGYNYVQMQNIEWKYFLCKEALIYLDVAFIGKPIGVTPI